MYICIYIANSSHRSGDGCRQKRRDTKHLQTGEIYVYILGDGADYRYTQKHTTCLTILHDLVVRLEIVSASLHGAAS